MAFAANGIDKEVFDGGGDLLNGVERDVRIFEKCLKLWNAARCIVYHYVQAVTREHETGNSWSAFELSAQAARFWSCDRQNAFAHAGFQVGGSVAEKQLPLMKKSDAMTAFRFI